MSEVRASELATAAFRNGMSPMEIAALYGISSTKLLRLIEEQNEATYANHQADLQAPGRPGV